MSVPGPAVLVVEDEADQRRILRGVLIRAGYRVSEASTVDEALAQLAEQVPDVVLCDWRMPGRDGGELLQEVRRRELPVAFVVMTAYGSIEHAVEAVRRGADDYLAKPFERDAMLLAVERVLRTRRLEHENERLRREVADRDGLGELVGRAPSMQRVYRTIDKVAATDATVLVTGESGTGKELVARMLHRASRRTEGPFVAVNCAAIPDTLIESELFGHERGAFTGAHRRREGRFEEAAGGTLFLDEIASMPLALQATLLRVLQERCLTRLGGAGEVAVDARVVAATNRDLGALVAAGGFREDLYYRLNVVPLVLPPLRARREDLPALVEHLAARAARRHGVEVEAIPTSVLRRLLEYDWPGNVRELANVLERLVLLAEEGRVNADDLPLEVRQPGAGDGCPFRLPAGGIRWDEVERGLIQQALGHVDGNRAAAARLLGLSYKTFLYRLEKHDLDPERSSFQDPR